MPRDGGATRERILATAERLMVEQGYNATTLDQVIAAAASSKGAFFHHFDSKSDLAQQLTERYVAADLAHLHDGLDAVTGIADPAERVIAFLRFYEDGADDLMAEQSGCLYATVLAEREFTASEINDLVAKATLEWRAALADLLRPALAGRWVDVDVDDHAHHHYTTFEGAVILCRTLQARSAKRAHLRVLRQLVEVLLRGS